MIVNANKLAAAGCYLKLNALITTMLLLITIDMEKR